MNQSILLSACFIVKNEADNIRLTWPSFLNNPLVEIIMVDTGSSDNTVALAKEMGALVFHYPWDNNFSNARNESLKRASSDWVLWIDADEYLAPEELAKLLVRLKTSPAAALNLTLKESQRHSNVPAEISYKRVKVFRNHQDYHFVRPFNEQVVDQNDRLLVGEDTDVTILHLGAASQESYQLKKERNIRYLEQLAREFPADPQFHYLLGTNYYEIKDFNKALLEYQAALKTSRNPELAIEALNKITWCYAESGDQAQTRSWANRALGTDPDNPSPRIALAKTLINAAEYGEAETLLRSCLQLKPTAAKGIPTDQTYYSYLPKIMLGQIYLKQQDFDKSYTTFKELNREKPSELFGNILKRLEPAVSQSQGAVS